MAMPRNNLVKAIELWSHGCYRSERNPNMKTNFNVKCSVTILVLMGWSALESGGRTYYMLNGGFECCGTGWILEGAPFGVVADDTPGRARSGSFYAWLGGAANEADDCYQLMTIPTDAASATLSFYYNIVSQDT